MERNRPAGGPAVSDRGPDWQTSIGIGGQAVTLSGSTGNITSSPTTGQKLVITDIIVSSSVATTVTINEEDTAILLFTFYIPANGTIQITPRGKVKLSTANKRLQADVGLGNATFTVLYYSEA